MASNSVKEAKETKETTGKLIPKKALIRAAFIWETWVQTCYNYERMMGMACAHTFLPVVKYLYPNNKDKQIDMMTREMEFFNVHPEFGSCILGLAVSLEEEKALGKDIPNEFITNIKTSLMGPLAGIGDTIWQGVLIPILLALCIDITRSGNGNIWGAIIYAVLMLVITYVFSVGNFMFGYRAGSDAIMDFLEKGIINKLLKGASIMGCMGIHARPAGLLVKAAKTLNSTITIEKAGGKSAHAWSIGIKCFVMSRTVLSGFEDTLREKCCGRTKW